ncbi:MAG: hypothetical protein K6U02_12105 [Firmicutes bacterium]|nr:hypothetical protein [Bacillota bacterium]
MIAARLVRMIEANSEALASSLMQKLKTHRDLPDLNKVPAEELCQRVFEVYRHLSDWITSRSVAEIERRYRAIGARRAMQGVPLSQLVYAILLVKEHLWEFLEQEGLVDRHVELFQEMELLHLVNRFFDRAVFYAALGYEQAHAAQVA